MSKIGTLKMFLFLSLIFLPYMFIGYAVHQYAQLSLYASASLVFQYLFEIVAILFVFSCINKCSFVGRLSRACLRLLLSASFLAVSAIQYVSFKAGGVFIPLIAFQNADNAGLLLTQSTRIVMVVGFIFFLLMSLVVFRDSGLMNIAGPFRLFFCLAILLLVSVGFEAQGKNANLFRASKNYPDIGPVSGIVRTLLHFPVERNVVAANYDFDILGLEKLYPAIDKTALFPFVKEKIYQKRISHAGKVNPIPSPHVLVLFIEGFSSRTFNFYDSTFPGLTPNLDVVARDNRSTVFKNYWNHTAATFEGLRGQLCSLYPAAIPHENWRSGVEINYFSLADVARKAGYNSLFLDPHFEQDYLHDMLSHLGFDRVLTGSEIKEYYTSFSVTDNNSEAAIGDKLFHELFGADSAKDLVTKINSIGLERILTETTVDQQLQILEKFKGQKEFEAFLESLQGTLDYVASINEKEVLSNAVLFDVLARIVEGWEGGINPQFLAAYPFETHAFLDTRINGVKYHDGSVPALNTIHDLDVQFGRFWKRFQESAAFDNTVVVITSDHARYHENSYVEALQERSVEGYQTFFADRIPFVIFDPRKKESENKSVIDASHATSIDFAPTLAHYLDWPNIKNSFLGSSIFERSNNAGLVQFSDRYYIVSGHGIADISSSNSPIANKIRKDIINIHDIIQNGRMCPKSEELGGTFIGESFSGELVAPPGG